MGRATADFDPPRRGCITLRTMGLIGRNTDTARTRLWTRGSQTVLAFVHAAKKRRKTVIISGVVITLLVVAVAFGALRYVKAEAAQRVVDGYSALSQCLLGPPLGGGELASSRVRGIQLAALTRADSTRAASQGEAWPDRCARHALILQEGLEKSALADSDQGKKLLESTKVLAAALAADDAHFADLSDAVDQLFGDAQAAGIALVNVASEAAPPEPVKPLTIDELAKTPGLTQSPVDMAAVSIDAVPGGSVHVLIDDAKGGASRICRIGPSAATCTELAKPAADARGELRLVGSADDNVSPILAAAKAGGVFRADSGAAISDKAGLGGHVSADGRVVALTFEPPDGSLELMQVDGDRVRTERVSAFGLTVEQPRRDAFLGWQQLLLLGKKSDQRVLQGARIEDGRLGRLEEIGVLESSPAAAGEDSGARVDGCRSAKVTVARARLGTTSHLAFWLGDRWTKPLKVPAAAGKLSCHGSEALITRFVPGREDKLQALVTQHVCSPTSCQAQSLSMTDLLAGEPGLAPDALADAVAVGDKLMFAWVAGQRGGVRLRVASAGKIADETDVIALDDLVKDGKVQKSSVLLDMRLAAAESFAVLLLDTSSGLRALRVSPEGRVTPVTVGEN